MKRKLSESKLRSVLITITGRLMEIGIGTFVISYLILNNLPLSLGIAILNETICACTTYFNLRIWNLCDWGRRITHEGAPRTEVLKRGIYEVEVTLYKSGNVRVVRKNLATNKEEVLYTRKKKNGKGYIG